MRGSESGPKVYFLNYMIKYKIHKQTEVSRCNTGKLLPMFKFLT